MIKVSIGERYSRLSIVMELAGRIKPSGQKYRMFLCECECGNRTKVRLSNLKSGNTTSCGCFGKQQRKKSTKTHGFYGTRVYIIWACMKQRCTNKKNPSYSYYGGRGINFCEKWKTFVGFWEDMEYEYFDDLTLERIDNNGNYCKENCKWASRKEQARNTRQNRIIEFRGEKRCLSDWANKIGIAIETLRDRLSTGWSLERALTTPPIKDKDRKRNSKGIFHKTSPNP